MASDAIQCWSGDFGREYTDRNPLSVAELDGLYAHHFGLTRSSLNREFLGDLPRDTTMLEVGTNVGVQLLGLKEMGFSALHGIEIQRYAITKARKINPTARLCQASAFALPFPDSAFELTYTSGVLIHVAPADVPTALDELYRCSSRYIWGWEYYADAHTEITYRGHTGLMWKGPFSRMLQERFPDLVLVREQRVKYVESPNFDHMYLLEKKPS